MHTEISHNMKCETLSLSAIVWNNSIQSVSANRECKIEHAVSVCTNTALPVWKEVPSDSSAAQHSRRLLVRLTPHPPPPPPLFIASF